MKVGAKKTFHLDPARVSALVSASAIVVLAIAVNVFMGRHYSRWDVTEGQRYSLTSATKETLRALPEAVHVWVLMSAREPLAQNVKQTLVAYRAESQLVDVKYIDPERDTLAFEDAKKRFRIETARASEGQIVTDAAMVVFMGDRHRYISVDDLVDVSGARNAQAGKDAQVRPREEQAITLAIRHVVQGEKTRLCFTRGHGELNLDDGSDRGLGLVRDILEKDNYETKAIDLLGPAKQKALEGCDVVIAAGPRDAFTANEDELLLAHVTKGAGLLVAAGPLFAPTEGGTSKLGLDRTLGAFGIQTVEALVVEKDAERAIGGDGIAFVAEPKPHAITNGLVPQSEREIAPRIAVQLSRALKRVTGVDASPFEVLVTSEKSYGVTNVKGAAEWDSTPTKAADDVPGPVVVGMACELPKRGDASHGPRAVVLGSASFFSAQNFREPLGNRGAALITESAISWLGAKPPILDIPAKAAVPAGIRITESSRTEVRRYVLFFMPGGVVVLALALFFSRKGREGAAYKRTSPPSPTSKPAS